MRSNLKAWTISVFTFILGVVATIFLGESIVSSSIYPWAENIVNMLKKPISQFIERAEHCFEKAREVAAGNVLWEGDISYNKARVDLMKYLMHLETDRDLICKTLSEIVRVRENTCFLFGERGSYLDGKFAEEVERAKNLKCNFKKLLRAEKKK